MKIKLIHKNGQTEKLDIPDGYTATFLAQLKRNPIPIRPIGVIKGRTPSEKQIFERISYHTFKEL